MKKPTDLEWHHLTEEEENSIGKAGLNAAWKELQILRNEKIETAERVLAGINAFRATRKALNAERKKLEKKLGKNVSCYFNDFSIVASAAYVLTHDTEDVHHYCVGGQQLEAVMRAALVMRGIYEAWSAFDDDDDTVFGIFLEEEAGILAEKLNPRKAPIRE